MGRTGNGSNQADETRDFVVGRASELAPGGVMHASADDREFVVINRDGVLHAYRNECPHQGAPMSYGIVTGAMKPTDPDEEYEYGYEGDYIACPRHRWKFSIETGRCIFDVDPRRMTPVDVREHNGDIVLTMRTRQSRSS